MHAMWNESVQVTVRMSDMRIDSNSEHASGEVLPSSVSTQELDCGSLDGGKKECGMLCLLDAVSEYTGQGDKD